MLWIFRLIRIRTIVYAIFTMYMMRYFVIRPILGINGFTLQMTDWAFSLLVVSVSCLIAGGYVINDYFDTRADRISGVKTVVVGRSIGRRAAIILHSVLNVIAISIALFLSIAVGVWKISILFFLVSGLLWFYSSYYKKYLIVGNLVVAVLAALIPLSVLIFEIPLLNMAYADLLLQTHTDFLYLFRWVLGFSYFAFLNTLLYEINKDLYTINGDREKGICTIPVKWGMKTARYVMAAGILIALGSVGGLYLTVFSVSLPLLEYSLLALAVPYLVYLFIVLSGYGKRSLQLGLIRLIMILTVSVAFLFQHFFHLIFTM